MVSKVLLLTSMFAVLSSACRHVDSTVPSDLRETSDSDALFTDAILNAELHAPLKSMFDAKDQRETYDVDIDTLDSDPPWSTEGVTFAVDGSAPMKAKVRVRGGVRRNCSFPPLKLKLAKNATNGTVFAGFSAFKIGTHCEPDADHRLVPAREDALVRLYAVLSKIYFRARLMRLTYVDQSDATTTTEPALLLEEPDDIAARLPGFEEFKPTWLEQAISPKESDSPEIRTSREQYQGGAMLQVRRIEVIDEERQRRRTIHPEWSGKKVEESLNADRDDIWRAAQLPGFADPIVDVPELLGSMETALAPRRAAIVLRQQALKASLDPPTVAQIIVFEVLAMNTDWNIFGTRALLSDGGGSDDNLKNVKVLRDSSGRLFPVPYDFDLADVFGAHANPAHEYKTRLTNVLSNLDEHSMPSRTQFVTALQVVIAAETALTTTVASSHLETDDRTKLAAAVHAFVAEAALHIP